jgi:hypothetical protein
MAKVTRKVSASQRDKFSITIAKILKKKGVLSKQTKLHGGRYVSRSVLKKVREFQHVAKDDYKAVKVPRALAKKAREEGYQVVGNRVIAPNDRNWIARLKKGVLSGLKPIKGGYMVEVTIPFTVDNVDGLIHRLQTTSMDDLKLEDELFAFSIGEDKDNAGDMRTTMSFKAFQTTDQMRDWLQHYNPELSMSALKFYRLLREDHDLFILGEQRRAKLKPKNIIRKRSDERESYINRLDRLNPTKADRLRKKWREKAAKKQEAITADPAKHEAAKARARERMRAKRAKT